MEKKGDRFPRKFVADGQALDSFPAIEPYLKKLLDRPLETADAVVAWLHDASELVSCVEELGTDCMFE